MRAGGDEKLEAGDVCVFSRNWLGKGTSASGSIAFRSHFFGHSHDAGS